MLSGAIEVAASFVATTAPGLVPSAALVSSADRRTYAGLDAIRVRLLKTQLSPQVAAYVIRAGSVLNQADVIVVDDSNPDPDILGAVCDWSLMALACSSERIITLPRAYFLDSFWTNDSLNPTGRFVRTLIMCMARDPIADRLHRVIRLWRRERADDLAVLQGWVPGQWQGATRYAVLRDLLDEMHTAQGGLAWILRVDYTVPLDSWFRRPGREAERHLGKARALFSAARAGALFRRRRGPPSE